MAAIETVRVHSQEPFHADDEVGLGRFDDEMKMVGHQDIGMNLPAGAGTALGQEFEEGPPIGVVLKDAFAPIATVEQVVDGTGILQPKLARNTPSSRRIAR